MAYSEESVNDLIKSLDYISLEDKEQQSLDIQECWDEAKICISWRKGEQDKDLGKELAWSLQYMVQRKIKKLTEILKELGCSVDLENSKKFLKVCIFKDSATEEFVKEILEKIQETCGKVSSKQISIKESILPFIEKKFYEAEKLSLGNGEVQIIRKTTEQYLVVGMEANVKKSCACLEKLCKEILIEKIGDMERFNVLKVKEKLKGMFRNVNIQEEKSLLVLRGSEIDLAKCSSFLQQCLDLKKNFHKSGKIPEDLYSKLKSDSKRNDIYKSLREKGLHVYWCVSRNNFQCALLCYGIEEQGLEDAFKLIVKEGDDKVAKKIFSDGDGKEFKHKNEDKGLEDAFELTGREGDETDKIAKRNFSDGNRKGFEHTASVLRIKRGMSFEYIKSKKEEIEGKTSCSVILAKRDAEEPSYYKSWIINNRNIVIAEGNVENSVTDIIVCPVDENFEPAGESAEHIFLKGGWIELDSAAQHCKSNCNSHNKYATVDAKKCACLSSSTGSLNCRKILFLSCTGNVELLMNKLWDELKENIWRSIYFAVDQTLIANGMAKCILDYFSKKTKTNNSYEIVLCIPKGKNKNVEELEQICKSYLHDSPICFYTEDTQRNGEVSTCSCPLSPIEVEVKPGSILEYASKVDAIVNSTNTHLKLNEGFVSSRILRHGGMGIQENLTAEFKEGIKNGDIAVSIPGKLQCKIIIHCVLLNWISIGNLSCKVLSSVVKKCLQAVESHGYQTIAIPALGTGNLKYSYLHVARTMLKAIEEYGKAFPSTGIKKVIFVLHESDEECIQTFFDVWQPGTDWYAKDPFAKDLIFRPAKIQFLENRIPARGLLIQLMSEEIDEPVDAIIKFESSSVNSKAKHKRLQQLDQVNLVWNVEKTCYTATFSLGQQSDDLESIVGACFSLLQSKRMISTRIDIRDIGRTGDFEKVMDAFCRNVTTTSPNSMKMNTDKDDVRYLKKLQILTSQEEIQKIKHTESKKAAGFSLTSWFANLLKGDCDNQWRLVDKKQTKDLICCVRGPTKETTVSAMENLRKEIGVESMVPGRYCFIRDYKWKFLSIVCNMKLCEAEENGLQFIDIKSEDGIIYSYNLEEMERKQKENPGDTKMEKLLYIQGNSQIPFSTKSTLWCVQQNKIWMFLPLQCCELLNRAVMEKKQNVSDDENCMYDLNKMKRQKITADREIIWEEIISVNAEEIKESIHIKKMKNENQNVVQIFDSVSGKISYGEDGTDRDKNKIKRELEKLGCTVISTKNNGFEITGNLSQIKKISELFRNERKETVPSGDKSFSSVVSIPMSERDYKILKHFGDNRNWFKKHNNAINFDGQGLSCVVQIDEHENIKEEIGKRLEEVRMMTSTSYQTTDESKKLVQVLADQYPNVCFLVNDKSTEIISDSYDDFVRLQEMLKPKEQAKKNRRAARTFAKSDTSEAQEALPSSNDVYSAAGNRYETNTPNSQTMAQPRALELKTAEGLLIKIYAGSITRLDVDCIVNAANEQLMHGGGVAAAISDAAGYQFDQESKQYIVDNGSLQVGSCCVTSAGKLRYKYVIHTVGPRWYDYNDKSRCMWDLQKSVMVTFAKADELKMKSIAIPAISSGIFAVPRDVCVEQYYKATMSFSSTHSCQSLKEIHFVDRDESMVKAIQEVFLQKLPPTSSIITEMSGNPNEQVDTPEDSKSTDKRDPLETPPSNTYTIVTVTDTLQIKIYLGNVTDIVADVIVCPQDELCSSDSQIARDIFSKNAGSKPLSGEMRFGKILCQTPHKTSSWKMVIHAVFPIYDDIYSKDPAKFGSQFYSMIQSIIETADKERYNSIVIPLLSEGKGEYQAPVELCALNFHRAVKELKSTLLCMKEIYLVLRKKGDESIFVEIFSDAYKITERPLQKKFGSDQTFEKTLTSKPVEEETCCICMDIPKNPKKLPNCGHVFCKVCIEESFKYKPACPSCGQIYGKMTGDQPPGTISIRKEYQTLEGFSDCKGTIVLTYNLPNGVQGDENPNPGSSYKGIYRSGYVPNNEKGRLVAKLLNVAFSRRLVFTIGHSRTTGEDGVITWNDIHHKTRTHGGPQRFGYPDPTYLDRVMEELAVKGVTPDSADDPQEYKEYSRVFRY